MGRLVLKRHVCHLLVRIVALALLVSLFGCARGPTGQTEVVLPPGGHPVLIGSAARAVLRAPRSWTIDDARHADAQGQFQPLHAVQPNYGFISEDVWFAFQLHVDTDAPRAWVLEVGREYIELAEMFVVDERGEIVTSRSGAGVLFSARPIRSEVPLLPIDVEPGATYSVYLRVHSTGPVALIGKMAPAPVVAAAESTDLIFIGGYFAVMLAMALYHVFLGLSLRDKSYLWLSAFPLAAFGVEFGFHGTLFRFVQVPTNMAFVAIFLAMSGMAITGFAATFLSTETTSPRLHLLLQAAAVVAAGGIFAVPVSRFALAIGFACLTPAPFIALAACIVRIREGFAPARYVALALGSWVLPVGPVLAFFFGLLPPGPYEPVAHVGMVALICFTSLAIADRIRRDRAAAAEAIETHTRNITTLNEELRRQVAERSRQLAEVLTQVERGEYAGDKLMPGTLIAKRYSVVRQLGEGGMGAVFEVERATDGARFALKTITTFAKTAALARLAREAQVAASVSHPHLVSVVDVDISREGTFFIVMELVHGGSLAEQSARFGDVTWAIEVLLQITEGLIALHDAGVVHRDLKPDNVLMAQIDPPFVKISDFGISRLDGELEITGDSSDKLSGVRLSGPDGVVTKEGISTQRPSTPTRSASETPRRAALTRTGSIMGTPLYMPPEAAYGAQYLGPHSDVWSLGMMAWEILCGKLPFQVPPVLLSQSGLSFRLPQLPSTLPLGLIELLYACLNLDPNARPDARSIAHKLAELRAGPTPPVATAAGWQRPITPGKTTRRT